LSASFTLAPLQPTQISTMTTVRRSSKSALVR
jgi:hypothetical protein